MRKFDFDNFRKFVNSTDFKDDTEEKIYEALFENLKDAIYKFEFADDPYFTKNFDIEFIHDDFCDTVVYIIRLNREA